MTSALLYVAAAAGEIAGCFAFWAWLRLGQSPWWIVPGIFSLVVFAVLLTESMPRSPGAPMPPMAASTSWPRSLWLWLIEGARPDRWDLIGASVCLGGAAIILFGPRSA